MCMWVAAIFCVGMRVSVCAYECVPKVSAEGEIRYILFRRLYVCACVYMHERKLSAEWQNCVVGANLYVVCIMHVCV